MLELDGVLVATQDKVWKKHVLRPYAYRLFEEMSTKYDVVIFTTLSAKVAE